MAISLNQARLPCIFRPSATSARSKPATLQHQTLPAADVVLDVRDSEIMSQPPPLRNRPNLHLGLTQLNGSPRHPSQSTPTRSPLSTPYPTSNDTPFAKTAYSPSPSASLKPPNAYEGPASGIRRRRGRSFHLKINWFRFKRMFSSKSLLLLLFVSALALWWFNGGSEELDVMKLSASGLGKELMQERRMHDYQFYPATNPKIHVRAHQLCNWGYG